MRGSRESVGNWMMGSDTYKAARTPASCGRRGRGRSRRAGWRRRGGRRGGSVFLPGGGLRRGWLSDARVSQEVIE